MCAAQHDSSEALASLRRWEEHGATWRVVHLSDDLAIVDLCTCYGEPVERLESGERDLIAHLRSAEPG